MADTDSLDLDAIAENLPAHYFDCDQFNVSHSGQRGRCDCTAHKDVLDLISYARSLESQLAERDEQIVRLKEDVEILQTHICDLLHPGQPYGEDG